MIINGCFSSLPGFFVKTTWLLTSQQSARTFSDSSLPRNAAWSCQYPRRATQMPSDFLPKKHSEKNTWKQQLISIYIYYIMSINYDVIGRCIFHYIIQRKITSTCSPFSRNSAHRFSQKTGKSHLHLSPIPCTGSPSFALSKLLRG